MVITGANSGVGFETAVALAIAGDRVFLACRNAEKAEEAAERARARAGTKDIEVVSLDLASFASIRDCAARLQATAPVIDVLINNAGLILSERTLTVEGFETTFGVNHLGHFLLTTLLERQIKAATNPRIVNLSSAGHWGAVGGLDFDDLQSNRSYAWWKAYCRSKLANVMFTKELARRWPSVSSNAVHPGAVGSNFGLDGDTTGFEAIIMKGAERMTISPFRGALTSVHLATSPEAGEVSGKYWAKGRPTVTAPWARKPDADRRLWEVSEQLVAAGHP